MSHAGRHVSGSVSTVVSQRGLKKRHTRFGYDRNTVGLESTAQVAVPPTGFSDVANVALPHCAATPQLHSKGGEETDETAEVESTFVVRLFCIQSFSVCCLFRFLKTTAVVTVVRASPVKQRERVNCRHRPVRGRRRRCRVPTVMSRRTVPVNLSEEAGRQKQVREMCLKYQARPIRFLMLGFGSELNRNKFDMRMRSDVMLAVQNWCICFINRTVYIEDFTGIDSTCSFVTIYTFS